MAIILDKISKSYGSRFLFDGVTLSFNDRNRYGLTGPNGAGKSTLLKIMMGLEEATSGQVTLPEKVGILKQNIEDYQETTLRDAVISGNQRLWSALEERDALYEGDMTDEVGMRLGTLEEIIADEDGYSADSEAEDLLAGMGVLYEDFDKKMSEVPTDLQFRVLLCQSLFGHPQALLLDEPTNHLDLESISWLETFLENYNGTVIVVSHDRYFLNSVTTHIADIDYETVILYPGNYDSMVFAKTSARKQEELGVKSKEKKVAKLKEFVAKFGAGSRASQVKSRQKEIRRIEPQELKQSNIQKPYIRFIPTEKQPGKVLFKVENLHQSYDDLEVIKGFSCEIQRGDKIGVIGNNGQGKTTLLKVLAGVLEPSKGDITLGHEAKLCYFPQNHTDLIEKTQDIESFSWLRASKSGVYDQEIRSVMGKMLFGGDDAFKKVASLSGGETARLILAWMMLQEHNLLVLDEPNNHLDLEAVSALAWGLEEYKGTAIVASHDRDLISRVANKIIAFEDGQMHFFTGTLDEYLEKQLQSSN